MKKLLIAGIVGLLAATGSVRAGDAKAQYDQTCAKCHGADGAGDTRMGKKLGAKDYTDAFKSIKEGLKDADGKNLMKPAEDLSDDDIKALVTYMRTFKK